MPTQKRLKKFTHVEYAKPKSSLHIRRNTCFSELEKAHDSLQRNIPTITQEETNDMANFTYQEPSTNPNLIPHFCAPVTHPVTGEIISKYKKLINDPLLCDTRKRAFGK